MGVGGKRVVSVTIFIEEDPLRFESSDDFHDVSQFRDESDMIAHFATYDPLTVFPDVVAGKRVRVFYFVRSRS